MPQNQQLKATSRDLIGNRKRLAKSRDTGQIPAVVYGHRETNRSIFVPRSDFLRVYRLAGESTLVDLLVDDGKSVSVLVQDVQIDPVSQELMHVDFHQVNLKEKITARIKLHFIGVAPAVKEAGGVLMTNRSDIEVSCLPQDLIHEITVDISALKTFTDYVHVRDLMLPKGMSALANAADVVAHVMPPRSEEELKALEQQPAALAAAEVPVEGAEKKESTEHEEGKSTEANTPAKNKE